MSARTRDNRNVSDGSGEKSARASGNKVGPPERACVLCSKATKADTKAPAYHVSAQDGSIPVETEPENAPLPPDTVLELAPTIDTPALVLNDPAALAARLATYGESRRVLVEWLLSKLVAGIDFTLIHRKVGPRGNKSECPNAGNMVARICETCGGKSTLCKPGSEKICGLLQLRPRFRRDVETWEMLGSEPGVVALVCELVTASGVVVAEGRGARHRDQDYGDVNKTVKMVQKSGQTDAVLRLAGLSEIFSQDLEDLPGYVGGDDNGAEFQAPRAKSGAATPAPPPPAPKNLEGQLRESVERAKEARAAAGRPAPAPTRPAPRPTGRAVPRPQGGSATGQTPPDALSPARVNRLMAILHEEIRRAEVPEEQHEKVFGSARAYLTEWVGRTGRERISDCSWKDYDQLVAEVPNAVDAALGGEGPAPRPRPRLVRRSYGAPKPFARRGY